MLLGLPVFVFCRWTEGDCYCFNSNQVSRDADILLSGETKLFWHLLIKFLSLYSCFSLACRTSCMNQSSWVGLWWAHWKKCLVWPSPFAYVRTAGSHVHSKNVCHSVFGDVLITVILFDYNSNSKLYSVAELLFQVEWFVLLFLY